MKILLHICCAVCATSCVERLRKKGQEVTGFFFNPNIQPHEEYLKRLGDTKEFARQENLPLIVGNYEADEWLGQIKGLEAQPEGGRRCLRCFQFRLEKTAKVTKENNLDFFATTLTVSPHKNAKMINEIGENVDNGLFLAHDFKKQDGFKRAQELAKRYNLYHQDYCGCTWSLKGRQKK